MERTTTQQTLQYIKRQSKYIRNNGTKDGLTKEQWKQLYTQFEEIANTLSYVEMKILYCTRQCPLGTAFRFVKVAKKMIEAIKAMEDLTE